MPEPRFGHRPPAVVIIGQLGFSASANDAFTGQIPPWVVLAGASKLTNPATLQFTGQLPAATFSIAGTVEAPGAPPQSSGIYTLRLMVRGPFLPNKEKQIQFPWPAGEQAIKVEGSISVAAGYNNWRWAQFNAFPVNYRDFDWTVLG